MPIKLKANNGNIDLKVPIKQLGGGAVDSVNGMTGDVVLDIPSKTSQLINDSGFITEHQDISGLATKGELKAVEDKIPTLDDYALKSEIPTLDGLATTTYVDNKVAAIDVPSLDGYATEQWVEGKGYLTQHQSLTDYATKTELEVKQDKLTAGDNITIADGVISASASGGSNIKSINFTTNTIPAESADGYKEALTYLWGNCKNGSVDLSKCIVTIDGVVVTYVYIQNPYIYFYTPVSAGFTYDSLRQLNQYNYFCSYAEAIAATSNYIYIKKIDRTGTLLTSDNYTQYISMGGTCTTDISDSNLYNAKEVYVHITTSDNRNTLVDIRVPENYTLGEKTNEYYYFPESENSNGYLYYNGASFDISGSNSIDYIWYK